MNKQLDFQSYLDKLPPASIEAEETILGGILMDPNAFSVVDSILKVDAFYIQAHQTIYRAAKCLYKEEREINLLTVTDWLRSKSKLLEIGGLNKLALLVQSVISTVNIDELAKLVQEKYLRRQLIEIGNNIVQRGYDQLISTTDYLSGCKKKIEHLFTTGLVESETDKITKEYNQLIQKINDIELTENNPGRKHLRLSKLAKESGYSMRELENLYRKSLADFSETALKSIGDLLQECGEEDRKWLLHGFIPEGTTILLHAQGGVGKTKLAYEFAYNLNNGTNWGDYPVTQKAKVLCYQTDETPQDMKHALLARGFRENEDFKYRDNWVVDAIPQLRADIEEFQPKFVIIDSLTTVSRHSIFSENDTEYARPLLQMVQIAKEYNCTIMIVHHSNSEDRSRGTRAIFNSVSEVWNFKEDKSERSSNLEKLLHIEKSRSRMPMTYRLRFDPDNYSWQCLGREGGDSSDLNNKDKVLKLLSSNRNTNFEAEEIAEYCGIGKSTAYRILNYLKSEGAISRKDRGQKNRPYSFYISENSSHPPLKLGCTDEKNQNAITTKVSENASQGIKKVLTTDEKNITPITTGISENASHPPAIFSENPTEKNPEKMQQGEKHFGKPLQDKEKILLTPPNQNSSHPPTEKKVSIPLDTELNNQLQDSQESKERNCQEKASGSGQGFSSVVIEKLGKFGIIKAEFTPANAPRKGSKTACIIKCQFPDETFKQYKRYVPLTKRDQLERHVEAWTANWEHDFMLNSERRWDVQQISGDAKDPKIVWVKGCQMIEAKTLPMKQWYRFKTPAGQTIQVAGDDEFKICES